MWQQMIRAIARSFHPSLIAALLGGVMLTTVPTAIVHAAPFVITVTTTADSANACTTGTAPCSLRDAIGFANTHYGASDLTTITLPASIGLYAIASRLTVEANVTINGVGASTAVIDGSSMDHIFTIFPNETVTINNVTIQDGNGRGTGGGSSMRGRSH